MILSMKRPPVIYRHFIWLRDFDFLLWGQKRIFVISIFGQKFGILIEQTVITSSVNHGYEHGGPLKTYVNQSSFFKQNEKSAIRRPKFYRKRLFEKAWQCVWKNHLDFIFRPKCLRTSWVWFSPNGFQSSCGFPFFNIESIWSFMNLTTEYSHFSMVPSGLRNSNKLNVYKRSLFHFFDKM